MDLTGLLDYEGTHHTVRETYDHRKAHEETERFYIYIYIYFYFYFQPLDSNPHTKLRIKEEFHHRNNCVNLKRSQVDGADAVMDLRHALTHPLYNKAQLEKCRRSVDADLSTRQLPPRRRLRNLACTPRH